MPSKFHTVDPPPPPKWGEILWTKVLSLHPKPYTFVLGPKYGSHEIPGPLWDLQRSATASEGP